MHVVVQWKEWAIPVLSQADAETWPKGNASCILSTELHSTQQVSDQATCRDIHSCTQPWRCSLKQWEPLLHTAVRQRSSAKTDRNETRCLERRQQTLVLLWYSKENRCALDEAHRRSGLLDLCPSKKKPDFTTLTYSQCICILGIVQTIQLGSHLIKWNGRKGCRDVTTGGRSVLILVATVPRGIRNASL